MHVIHFNYLHSSITQPYLPSLPPSSLHPNKSACYIPIVLFCDSLSLIWLFAWTLMGSYLLEHHELSRGCFTENKHSSSSSNNCLPMVVASLVQITQTLWSHESSKESILLCSFARSGLYILLSASSFWSPNLRWDLLGVLLRTEYPTVQHFDQLWASGFTHCKRIFPDKS